MPRPPQYETLTIKKENTNIDAQNVTTGHFYLCECCSEYAEISIEVTKRAKKDKTKLKPLKNGKIPAGTGRPKKLFNKMYLCGKHKEELKKLLKYF